MRLTLATSILLAGGANAARLITQSDENRVDHKHIVVLRKETDPTARFDKMDRVSAAIPEARVRKTFRAGTFNAFAVEGLTAEELNALLENEDVDYIEESVRRTTQAVQENPEWGLDRIDQTARGLDNQFNPGSLTGSGVTIYILDNGMLSSHTEFGDRVAGCVNIVSDREAACEDGNSHEASHGTHVGAIAAGSTYGVAKEATLYNIKVLTADGGEIEDTINGVQEVVTQKENNANTPMVANLSLGGPYSQAENDAVDAAHDAGIVMVVAAGNERRRACRFSPAAAPKAITVGAINRRNRRALFSNWGSCVDIFAPGTAIVSATSAGTTATTDFAGTSQAAPFVAGAAALYLQANPTWTPDQVLSAMLDDATRRVWWKGWGSPRKALSIKGLADANP